MRMGKFWVLSLVFVLLAVFVVGCGGDILQENENIKVGFVYIGAPGDAGWTYAHDQGRKYLEKELPGVETVFLQDVDEGADAERSIEQLAQEDCKIIFANSFGYGQAMLEVASRYPEVKFMHCTGLETADNMATYFGRVYQARYLSGMIAGKMTENNTLGYVAAFGIPEVVRGINAFTLGAQSVNPDVKVKVVWTTTWYDPIKEKDAAKSLLEDGCDVLAQHQDTPSPQIAAEEVGKYAIGYNSDMRAFAPEANLTSPIWNWGPYYVKTVKSVLDGTWQNEQYWGGLSDGIVDLAPISDKVPAEVKELVETKKSEISNNEWDVFTGIIKDQDGNIKVKDGEKLSDQEMLNMDWFVEGVEGTIMK